MAVATEDSLNVHFSWTIDQEEVMCVCISQENNILTGHESRMLIWSVDINSKEASLKDTIELPLQGTVSCICQFLHEASLALAIDKTVLVYQYSVVNNTITSLSLKRQFCFSQDEINQLDVHPKRSLLCSCDDNGEIAVIDVDSNKIVQTLSGFHDSICSTVKFSIRKPWELLSGGLDCTIGRWDFGTGRLLASTSTKDESSSGEALMINPPMIHSLDVFHDHHSMVCGLGDGRLVAYSLKHPKSIDMICEVRAHLTSIACVRCIERKDAEDTYVVSVGNDETMCVHKLTHKTKEKNNTTFSLISKLSCVSKVNCIDVLCGNVIYIFTADVTGGVSIYSFK